MASSLYLSNIRFARSEVAYFDVRAGESPLLHTWSLSIEEQFYVVWPVLIGAMTVLLRGGRRMRRGVIGVFAGVAAVSWALSLVMTARLSPWAFYSLPTRAWEFAAGGLVAVALGDSVPGGVRRRNLSAVAGMSLLALAAAGFDGAQPYPGWRAMVPVVATVLLISSGGPGVPATAVHRALAWGPARWVGRLSYSWYLWHWPAMVIAVAFVDRDTTGVRAVAGGASFLLAVASLHLVEDRVRFHPRLTSSWRRTMVMGVTVTAAVLVATVAVGRYVERELASDRLAALVDAQMEHRGVACAATDRSASGIEYCVDGDLEATRTVMLIGDSHARQWIGAFAEAASRSRTRLVVRWKSVCPSLPVRVTSFEGIEPSDCAAFRSATMVLVGEVRPDVVVVANYNGYQGQVLNSHGRVASERDAADQWGLALERHLVDIAASGGGRPRVVVDNPRLPADPLVCMSRRGNTESTCRPSRVEALAAVLPFQVAEATVLVARDIETFGVTDDICGPDVCDLVQDGEPVFVDRDHLSPTWTLRHVESVEAFIAQPR